MVAHGDMDMDMDMSGSSSSHGDSMTSMGMQMTFFTATNTPLYSTAWTPPSTGAYVGTCIFLILLSVLLRLLLAIRSQMESQWRHQNLQRRYIVTAKENPNRPSDHEDARTDSRIEDLSPLPPGFVKKNAAVLTVNGLDENVRMIERPRGEGVEPSGSSVQPFRLSVDLIRAVLVTVMIGVAYLLMLAVMTYNVGYFMSVLGGAFLGELLFGRWSTHADLAHH